MTQALRNGQPSRWRTHALTVAALSFGAIACTLPAAAQDRDDSFRFYPNNLVLSRSVYDNNAANIAVGTVLPIGCANTTAGCIKGNGATNDGTFPTVFNNNLYDGSFGVTSKIFLDQITPDGYLIDTLQVPNSAQKGIKPNSNVMVTSFSSKSELALNLSTNHKLLSFMGYNAPIDAIDVSNSNTPGVIDPTNPVGEAFYRVAATVNKNGKFTFTETNAYSGNNGRVAILNNSINAFYAAGNAGNGGNPQPTGVILGAGAQFIERNTAPEYAQSPVLPTPLASFNITELGLKADKIGKDDNFRGLTIFNNVVYFTKGSGGNGVNTVYFVDTTGTACPKGVGLPVPGAKLPTQPLAYDSTKLETIGLPSNMCILAGFPTQLAKTANPLAYPFGIWFANANTLYVADEGDGFNTDTTLYTHAAAQTTAGLQKWVFDPNAAAWTRVYTLQNGLKLGIPYTVTGYPTGNNPARNLPWAPATDGLRNITGHVYDDGRVAIWGITSTVSGSGDQGADPNRLVGILDRLHNISPTVAAKETFVTLRHAGFAEVLRGISLTPGTDVAHNDDDHNDEN